MPDSVQLDLSLIHICTLVIADRILFGIYHYKCIRIFVQQFQKVFKGHRGVFPIYRRCLLYTSFDGFQVSDCPGKPVQYSLGLCMTVVMSVFSMGMHDSSAIFQNMGMHMLFLAFVQVVL